MRAPVRTPAIAMLLAVGAVMSFAGCSDATSPRDQVPGAYSLRSIGGQPLPVVTSQSASGTYTLTSDVLTLQSDGTVAEQSTQMFTPAGGGSPATQTGSRTGTWTFSGTNGVDVQLSGGSHLSGTFSAGNTFTVTSASATFVYQK